MKTQELIIKYCTHISKDLDEGILYVSKEYKVAIHLCACGCKGKTVTPLDSWKFIDNNGMPTLTPSIGNWSGENPYHAHYFITNGQIKWC